jgi:hypothetical protein
MTTIVIPLSRRFDIGMLTGVKELMEKSGGEIGEEKYFRINGSPTVCSALLSLVSFEREA